MSVPDWTCRGLAVGLFFTLLIATVSCSTGPPDASGKNPPMEQPRTGSWNEGYVSDRSYFVWRTDRYGDPLPPGAVNRLKTVPREHPAVLTTGALKSIDFSPSGDRLAAAYHNGQVLIWDVNAGEIRTVFGRHDGFLTEVRFFPDGERVVSAGEDGMFIWNSRSGEPITYFDQNDGHSNYVASIAYIPRNDKLVSTSRNEVFIRSLTTGGVHKQRGHTGWIPGVEVSPDGRRFAIAAHDGSVRVWDANMEKQVSAITADEHQVWQVQFTPDGQHLLSTGTSGIRLWSLPGGKRDKRFINSAQQAHTSALTPTGNMVVAGIRGGNIVLRDFYTGGLIKRYQTLSTGVSDVAVSPTGTKFATAMKNEEILIWPTEPFYLRRTESALPSNVDELWNRLAGTDVKEVYRAKQAIIEKGSEAIPFLRRKANIQFTMVDEVKKRINRLVKSLGATSYNRRRNARRSLKAKLEDQPFTMRPFLERRHRSLDNPEIRLHLRRLLKQVSFSPPRGDHLRLIRSIETLWRMNTPDARQLLSRMSRRMSGTKVGLVAKRAMDQLEHDVDGPEPVRREGRDESELQFQEK